MAIQSLSAGRLCQPTRCQKQMKQAMGNFLTFDPNCPDLSVAGTHHCLEETNSTKWIDQTNDVYLGPDNPFEEEGSYCTDTDITYGYSYPNEAYSSLM
jgi:hypothetical protein